MNELVQIILNNLIDVGIGVLLFIVAYASNMAFGLYYNIKVMHQAFDKSKLINSGIKIAAFAVGTVLLCVTITTIPVFANYVGFAIPEEYSVVFQDLTVLAVFITSTLKYTLKAYDKFSKILNTSSVED